MGFFSWLKRKKDPEIIDSFDSVKQDMTKISHWIKHLNTQDKGHDTRIDEIYDEIRQMRVDIDDIKGFVSFFDVRLAGGLFKKNKQLFNKQTAVQGVQTAVQTAFLRGLTSNERLIVYALANMPDMKLSYEDLAMMLGKEKATVRGQLNSIKQKNDQLINELVEKNGKKRYYVDEKVRELLFSSVKASRKSASRNSEKGLSKG
jgi:hypothetical protein